MNLQDARCNNKDNKLKNFIVFFLGEFSRGLTINGEAFRAVRFATRMTVLSLKHELMSVTAGTVTTARF